MSDLCEGWGIFLHLWHLYFSAIVPRAYTLPAVRYMLTN